MSPFEADLELDQIWPAWSRDSRLVVTLYDLIPLIMRTGAATSPTGATWRQRGSPA